MAAARLEPLFPDREHACAWDHRFNGLSAQGISLDLHFTADSPTAEEKQAVDSALDGAARRDLLLPVLHAINDHIGWISPGALNYASRRLGVPPAETYGVAQFYAMFSTTPRPKHVVHVCDDIACMIHGAEARIESLGRTEPVVRSPCLGLCDRAPAMLPAGAHGAGAAPGGGELPGRAERLLARIGRVDPSSLGDFVATGGFRALARARELGAQGVIDEVAVSQLLGRGGAAFPAGRKWQAVAAAPAPRYLVCNADESEPGTFKDRVLMEGDPFGLIEAITIAAFATGCERSYIYVRGEYRLASERLRNAIEASRAAGYIDGNMELRRGAGAYICGEETAMFNSIEGKRGEPRNKPPFPVEAGLFGRPTLVNNVETLANIPHIVLDGGAAFACIGTGASSAGGWPGGSTGTKLYCVSGHVARPGVYEFPFGVTAREVIDGAGGVAGSGNLQAVLLGGAAGAFISPRELDAPLTFEGTRAIGAALGSAVVMLFDDTVDLKRILLRIARFFREESCGQCVPCRVGTVRQQELLERLDAGRPLGSVESETALLNEIAQAMRDASICGLGHTAASAVQSALARFPIFR